MRLGIIDSTKDDALSIKTPLGSPLASLSIFPPIGSGVFLSIPANFNQNKYTNSSLPDLTFAASKSIDAVVHVKNTSIVNKDLDAINKAIAEFKGMLKAKSDNIPLKCWEKCSNKSSQKSYIYV